MGSLRTWSAIVPVAMVAMVVGACGGSNFTGIGGTDDDGGSDGSGGTGADAANNEAGGGSDSGNPNRTDATTQDGAVSSDGSPAMGDGGPAMADGGADGPTPLCPDVTGLYTITVLDGAGCGDLNPQARQCIRAINIAVCDVAFVSQSGGNGVAINGNASIQGDGSFANAALKEGSANRTGCVGMWNAVTSTMTVDCGGTGTSQSCALALLRTSSKCN